MISTKSKNKMISNDGYIQVIWGVTQSRLKNETLALVSALSLAREGLTPN